MLARPRLVALDEEIEGVALQRNSGGFARQQARDLVNDLRPATGHAIVKQFQSPLEPAVGVDQVVQVIKFSERSHDFSLSF
jgi:hypothetical protein